VQRVPFGFRNSITALRTLSKFLYQHGVEKSVTSGRAGEGA
jgi:hypothetical protein